jgi:hypothetical protein
MRPYKVLGHFTIEIMWIGLLKRNTTTFTFPKYTVGKVINIFGLLILISTRT